MTDDEIMKSADNENVKQRVKAIYPHIVVSGDIDKPYYNIHWYDIEKEEMYCGFSSFKLEIVRKWLKEEFEVVEADIDDLINRQKEEIERLKNKFNEEKSENDRLSLNISNLEYDYELLHQEKANVQAEAVREFGKYLIDCATEGAILICNIPVCDIPDLVKKFLTEEKKE